MRDLEVVEYGFGKHGYLDAATYDSVRYLGPAKKYQQKVMANAYKKLIGPITGKRILDVGCGTGRGVIDFAQDASLAIGVDASFDMLACAKQKLTADSKCSLAVSVAQRLPFRDATFDAVVSLNFLHLFNVDTDRMIVAEMKRVLKPGGVLVVDFNSALNAQALRKSKRRDGVGGMLPREIRYAIGNDCRIERVVGAPFPALWRVLYRFPRIGETIEKLGYVPPFNWLAQNVYCKVLKGS